MTDEIKPGHADAYYCWRCNLYAGIQQVINLCGNYHALLCRDCFNDHAVWLFALPEYKKLQLARINYDQIMAMVMHDGIERTTKLMTAADHHLKAQNLIFQLTEAWINQKIERPKPPEPEPAPKELTRAEKIANAQRRLKFAQRQLDQLENSPESPE